MLGLILIVFLMVMVYAFIGGFLSLLVVIIAKLFNEIKKNFIIYLVIAIILGCLIAYVSNLPSDRSSGVRYWQRDNR
jgi:hypothetical protein